MGRTDCVIKVARLTKNENVRMLLGIRCVKIVILIL
jgi:hypothetical protein